MNEAEKEGEDVPSLFQADGDSGTADDVTRAGAPPATSTLPPSMRASRPRRRRLQQDQAEQEAAAQDPVLATVLRIETLMKTLVRHSLRTVLAKELKDPASQVIYDATGEQTAREIAALANVGAATVSRTWARWEAMGIVLKDGVRYRRAF